MATQKELHLCPALVVLRLARATKPGEKYSSEWQSHQSRAVSGRGHQFKGFPLAHRKKKNQKGKPGTSKPFCLWQSPHGIWYDPKSKQLITSLLFSASLTCLCLDLLRLSFPLPGSLSPVVKHTQLCHICPSLLLTLSSLTLHSKYSHMWLHL